MEGRCGGFDGYDVTAENTNAVTLINIPLCSNIIQDESTTLYEINDSYYMTLAQIVQLTGFEIALGKDANNGDLHIFDFDASFDVIGKGYNTVTFIDGIREVKIDLESKYLYESGEHYAIRIEKYENQYLLEAIPLLKYLLGVDSCDMIDGVFRCEAPYETIWKALSDAFEFSKTICYDYSYFYEEYEKRIFFDISYQCFMDLRIPKIEEYYRKTIHDILSDNIYEYDGVQTISNEQDEYHSLDDLLDVVDVSKDVINNSASRITEQYINHQLQNLNTEWLETSDVRKSAELSKQINVKTNELINSKKYFDKMDSSLKAIMYGANIANAFAKNYAYNCDTATLLDDATDKDLLSNINTENWYWLDEANRINSSIKSNWSNIGNSVLDSTAKLFEDEGNDLLICSIAENASSYLLIVKAELMVGKLIFKDNYEKVDKDILSGFESDLQAQYKQLCNVLYLKARNELYTSEKTIDQMLAAYKFYYKLSAVYLKNVSIQFEQNNWMEDYADDAAKMYYRLLTCFKTPNSGFEKLEDDVFSQEAISQIKVVDYEEIYYSYIENELLPQYGLAELAVARDYSSNTTHTNLLGIVSAAIYDFCDDGTEELLVLTREKTDDVMSAYYLNLYQYTGNKVESLDRIETEEYSIHSGGEHGDSFEMIIAGNAVYQQLRTSRYGSSGPDANTTEYTIIDVNGYKFNKYQYSVNPVNVVDKSLNTVLHHDKTICAEWDFSDGCTECGLNTSITDAENAIRQKLDEIAFPYSSCTLSSENGLALNIGVNENMEICDYSSYQKFETIDYTKLRDHIATPQGADFSISSYTGRYGKDNIYVEISPVGDSEVDISVEFLSEEKNILSSISYHDTAEKFMSFEASDHSSRNAYTVEFLEDTVRLTVHRIEYINEFNAWDIPDTDITLTRLSEHTTNRDISSWTNDMIANAINQYLDQRVSYATGYYVLSSEMEENEYGRYVYAHLKNGQPSTPQTNYIVTWDDQDDVAYFAVDSTDSFVRFHITDFDPNYASFIPEEPVSSWQQLYTDELRNYMNSDSYSSDAMFDLYDFDNNGILELIISSGEAHLCTCSIFGIKNGALTLLCEDVGEYGSISAYEGGVVCGTFTPSGPGQTTKYTRFVKISSGDSESLYELTAEGFPPDYDRYTINGTEATEEEYRNIMNQYITQEPLQYSIGRKHPLDESTINSVLLS